MKQREYSTAATSARMEDKLAPSERWQASSADFSAVEAAPPKSSFVFMENTTKPIPNANSKNTNPSVKLAHTRHPLQFSVTSKNPSHHPRSNRLLCCRRKLLQQAATSQSSRFEHFCATQYSYHEAFVPSTSLGLGAIGRQCLSADRVASQPGGMLLFCGRKR